MTMPAVTTDSLRLLKAIERRVLSEKFNFKKPSKEKVRRRQAVPIKVQPSKKATL